MEKREYDLPQLLPLGSVRELTELVSPTNCSALGEDFSTQDALCEIQDP